MNNLNKSYLVTNLIALLVVFLLGISGAITVNFQNIVVLITAGIIISLIRREKRIWEDR
jgi:hypothetical protein